MKANKIIKVYVTKVDGYINVITANMLYRFEGIGCCPKNIKAWMKNHPDKCYNTNSLAGFDD